MSYNRGNRVRLRISEIELHPALSKRAIKAELLVDGKVATVLPTIEGGQPLKWSKLIIWYVAAQLVAGRADVSEAHELTLAISDAYPSSNIGLVVYARQLRIYSQYQSGTCLVSEIMGLATKTLRINDMQYDAEVKMLDQAQVEPSLVKSREKLEKMDDIGDIPVKLKATQRMFKSMLEFGSAVAEVNPIAKMALAVCTRAWERFEEQQKSGEELDDLAGKLVGMAPLVDEVKKHAQLEALRHNIEEFLHLIEDVSVFVLDRQTKGFVVRVLKSVVDSSDRDRVEELGRRFQRISSDFEKAIGVQTMAVVTTAREEELLKRLNPVEPSGHDPSRACQEGTRLGVLGDIDKWIWDPNPSSTFMWIYGQAGIGKSTISASVCNRLSSKATPIASFFCKRDDPALRDPLHLINSVVYGLSCRYPPYAKLVAKEIGANSELCTSHLMVRYEGLLKKPLSGLRQGSPLPLHFILIDAMDECGAEDTRRQLLGYLLELSSLVPWLRVIVTSRPDSDIRSFFDHPSTSPVSRCDVQSYSAAGDIRAFIGVSIGDLAIRDEWPVDGVDRLCAKAGELFIWAATACKFILNADDSQDRLLQLLDGNSSRSQFDGLDSLYTTVIMNNMADQAADSMLNMRRCIGAIVTISTRQPVPIEVLCELMRAHMKPVVLRKVIGRLGAVLYSDSNHSGAIRVLHPSFADFALDEHRSGVFWVDPVQRNMEISIGCMSTLERELRFNICDLETSHLLNSEVIDMESRIDAKISGQLAYSCIYWIDHLLETGHNTVIGQVTAILDGPRLLYWLEVLSVLQRVDVAVQGLRGLSQWLKPHQLALAKYAWDAYRFVFAFSDPIIASAPHIYISALALAPRRSEVSRRLLPLFPNTIAVTEGGDETWPGWLRSIPQPAQADSMCISPDSQRLVTSCRNRGEPAQILVYNLRTGGLLNALRHSSVDHQSQLLDISPDGAVIASVSPAAEVIFWGANTGAMTYRFHPETGQGEKIFSQACRFSPDSTTLLLLVETLKGFKRKSAVWEIGPRGITNITVLQESMSRITGAAFSPDGAFIAIGYSYGQLMVISVSNPVDVTELKLKNTDSPGVIVFSADSSLIVVALHFGSGGAVQVWDAKTGVFKGELFGCTIKVLCMAFTSGGTQLITGDSDFATRVWDLRTYQEIGSPVLRHANQVTLATFSTDGTYILCVCDGSTTVQLWDSLRIDLINVTKPEFFHKQIREEIPDYINCAIFSRDGTRIISGSSGHTVQIWDAQTGIAIGNPLSTDSGITSVALSPDGALIVANTSTRKLYTWDISTGRQLSVKDEVYFYALSPNGNHLVTGLWNFRVCRMDVAMKVWDTSTGDMVKTLGNTPSHPEFIAFSPDGSRMFSMHMLLPLSRAKSSRDVKNQVYIWDTTSYNPVRIWDLTAGDYDDEPTLDGPQVHSLSSDGALMASSYNHTILIHDAHTGKAVTKPLFSGSSMLRRVAFSPDGNHVACCSPLGPIQLWNVKASPASENSKFGYAGGPTSSLAFSPDGKKLLSGHASSRLCVWAVSVNDASKRWHSDNTSEWPSDSWCFPPHPTHPGWISHDQKSLTLWLPDHYRQIFEPHLLFSISISTVRIDFSRFVHGITWTSVIGEGVLDNHNTLAG